MKPTTTTDLTTTKNKPEFRAISMGRAKKLAQELIKFLQNNSLTVEIAGKNYIPVEGWQFTGSQLGLTEIVQSCEKEDLLPEGEVKYKAVVEVINQHGTVVSRGFAWCSSKEKKKASFEEYAIASMAQTRAIGKAYRNILSWIVKMGGYEAMPAEEANRDQLENELGKAKQKIVKIFNDQDIISASDIVGKIEEIIGKRSIETIDEANKIIRELKADD